MAKPAEKAAQGTNSRSAAPAFARAGAWRPSLPRLDRRAGLGGASGRGPRALRPSRRRRRRDRLLRADGRMPDQPGRVGARDPGPADRRSASALDRHRCSGDRHGDRGCRHRRPVLDPPLRPARRLSAGHPQQQALRRPDRARGIYRTRNRHRAQGPRSRTAALHFLSDHYFLSVGRTPTAASALARPGRPHGQPCRPWRRLVRLHPQPSPPLVRRAGPPDRLLHRAAADLGQAYWRLRAMISVTSGVTIHASGSSSIAAAIRPTSSAST